ncbi:MAG: deoxyguanosinetriphosphate triphosphohydrolase [Candidatus Syntrophonatronum acetioxidans]|uniref:Deoxyguanosinetriphosphate triphosphohydrolase-like protein n=1 Tax=Candidatus Syntrophonatronum acetioxidans TaxID=1795816 RepID=A0A424YDQ6_9FIRM|nr:MAG: deoxyguanosinetriphosphate triphosphohydrolase [Candidatus Syntrophonatronum acetioxidans]
MNLREQREELENIIFSPQARRSSESKGRQKPEEECSIRTPFQRDRDRIIHSKAFRRLKHKTQVFISPEGDHYRTRLTHTLEVAQIARTIARALRLNEDLTEAIALGHDLGHTPFGHAGEEALNKTFPGGFRHNEQSLRVVEVLEEGKGLNLTWEVREGILKHKGSQELSTLEGQIVRIADRMAYINHDIDDAVRAGVLVEKDLPQEAITALGYSSSQRINKMVRDLIENSMDREKISMSPRMEGHLSLLREFMFNNVYVGSAAKREEGKIEGMFRQLYDYFLNNPWDLQAYGRYPQGEDSLERKACDYIAGMTDRYFIALYQKLFIPNPWHLEL